MSHFTVLVIGPDVERQLAPFHEFECTGVDDEFVQEIDKTEEAREDFRSSKRRQLRDPQGNLHDPGDPQFWRVPTDADRRILGTHTLGFGCAGGLVFDSKDWGDGLGYATRVAFVPEGWTEVHVARESVQTFAEFVESWYGTKPLAHGEQRTEAHTYGWVELDAAGEVVRVIDRTNPNKRWDWWVIGGRWRGMLKLREAALAVIERGRRIATRPTRVDSAPKGMIDFDGMRDEAGAAAGARYDKVLAAIGAHPTAEPWDAVRERIPDIEAARDFYHAQPQVKAFRKLDVVGFMESPEDFTNVTREQFVETARDGACSTHAVVQDGKWYEIGRMGWWAVVHDQKDESEWNRRLRELLDSLADDTLLTVVDCHI